jgi:hypothetical protein
MKLGGINSVYLKSGTLTIVFVIRFTGFYAQADSQMCFPGEM